MEQIKTWVQFASGESAILLTTTSHPAVPSAFTVWMARDHGLPPRGPPDAQASIWAQKCPRLNQLLWHQWWEISSQQQWGMFWQMSFICPSVKLYLSFLLQNGWTQAHHKTTPANSSNRCNRDSLQATRSTHSNQFERAGPEQAALDTLRNTEATTEHGP